jgi:uncharacterized protein
MSEIPSRDEAINLLKKIGCPQSVIEHVKFVSQVALEIASKCEQNGWTVDKKLIEIGALLHDVGRSKTHGISHAVVGAQIAKEKGVHDKVVRIIENHIGAGIPREEAEKLELPSKDYLQTTFEEKIVAYADKVTKGRRRMSYEEATNELVSSLGPNHPAIKRFRKLHEEISKMMGSDHHDSCT